MTKSEEYHAEAAQALAQAEAAPDEESKARFTKLANDWTALALAAEVHIQLDEVVVKNGGRSNPIDWD